MFVRKIYYLNRLMKNQWIDKDDLNKLQLKRLNELLHYVYDNIDLYRKKMDSVNIKPTDIKSLKDLEKIPVITKREIKKNFPDGIVTKKNNRKSLICKTTTGSTGEPLTILFDKKSWDCSMAFFGRALFNSGLRLSDKIAFFWYEKNNKSFFQNFGILRTKNIIYTEHEEKQLNQLISFKPDVICGLPTILSILADNINNKNIKSITPRFIFTFGEMLTDGLRKKIEDSFNSKIYDQYATTEFNWIGFECEKHDGFHLNAEGLIIETIEDEGKNKLIITDLNNHTMPMIRYDIGDIGIISTESCSCGRNLPLLQNLEGRQDDFLILPSNRIISPRMIGGLFESIKGIKRYKLLQKTKDNIEVLLVDDSPGDDKTADEIEKALKNTLKENIKISIRFVDKIPTVRGKSKVIESLVKT